VIKVHYMHVWKCHNETPYYVQFNICQYNLKINKYKEKNKVIVKANKYSPKDYQS
jgi:hypothetical protein